MKYRSTLCLLLVLSVMFIPGICLASEIGFDEMTPGLSVCFFDVNGDGFGDVIFNNLDDEGFEVGYAPPPTLIEGPGLRGSSISDMDVEILFTHGATDYLQFDFALTTYENKPGGHVYVWLYNQEGDPVGNSHSIYVQPTGDTERHEATVMIPLDETVASARLNFISQGGGNWFVIDNFEGNFAPVIPVAVSPVSIYPDPAKFGKTPLKTTSPMQVSLSNDGDTYVTLGEVTISGGTSQFSLSNDENSYSVLAPWETTTLDILFTPRQVGTQKAKLVIASEDEQIQHPEITLKGTGCPHIGLIRPNPSKPGETVVVTGEGFDSLEWIKVGPRKFSKGSKKVHFWDSSFVILELPPYNNWEKGVTVEKPVTVAVQNKDKIIKSKKYLLKIHKP